MKIQTPAISIIIPSWIVVCVLVLAQVASVPAVAVEVRDWWEVDGPLKNTPQVYGKYTRGCVAGAQAFPLDGPGHQVIRPSRDRFYGHPTLIRFLHMLSERNRAAGFEALLIGDMAQPRGGPMKSGHASHQLGLDADIWFRPAPNHRMTRTEREEVSAVSMLDSSGWAVDPQRFDARQVSLLRMASLDPAVTRIFVNPAIKQALCDSVTGDRGWLRKVRPWWGHHYHFHVRLRCPVNSPECVDQAPPPPGDSCDSSLAWWFSDEAKARVAAAKKQRPTMRRRIPLSELPDACRSVLLTD